MSGVRPIVALMGMLMIATGSARAAERGGIGVLGDSYSDEYQFYPPDRCTSRNWVEILAATRGLNFGRFNVAGWGEPRNQGYEYNWSRSDATTEDLIRAGQHQGLAAQIARGEVSLAVIFIGGNDFIHALESPDPDKALGDARPRAGRNFRTVLQTVLAASPDVKVVVSTVPDIREVPYCARALNSGRLSPGVAERYAVAIKGYNAQVRALAMSCSRVALVDFDLLVRLGKRPDRDYVRIAGRRLFRSESGNDLHHLFLKDDRHIGTMGQGLIAQMIVSAANAKFAAGIAPVGDRDILAFGETLAVAAESLADFGAVELPSVAPDVGKPITP